MAGPVRKESLWRLRDVRLIAPARAVSVLGDTMLAVVLLLYLQGSGAGVWSVTVLLAVQSLPIIVLTGVAGHVADTCDSRRILVTASAAQALACGLLAFSNDLPAIFVLVAVIQAGQAFTGPTWTALVPRVVGDSAIGRIIALQAGLTAGAAPVGAALGGILFGLADARLAILIDAATFVLLAVAALLVRTRRGGAVDVPIAETAGSSGNLLAGLHVLRRDTVLWPMTLAMFAEVLAIGGVNVVDVFLVRDVLNTSAVLYGLSEVAFALGSVGGSALAARVESDRRRALTALGGFAVVGGALVGEGIAPNFAVYLALGIVLGVSNTALNAAFGALVMRRTEDSNRGRVSAFLNAGAQVGMMMALVLGGASGAVFGPRLTFVIAGGAGIMVTGLAAVRVLRHVAELVPPTVAAAQS